MNRNANPGKGKNRRAWLVGLALIAAAAVRAAWSAIPIIPHPPIQAFFTPVSNTLATTRGCRTGGIEDINTILPEWVSVDPSDTPAIAEGRVVDNHVAFEDTPNAHLSHDVDFNVTLDPKYWGLHSDGNPDAQGHATTDNASRVLEIEWETKFLPTDFWPVPGDRFWAMGRWVFDCGHDDTGYHTEFHPALALAFTRLQPTTFAGDTTPSLTNQTHIFIYGRGGYLDQPVAIRNYEFDIPMPPKPSLFASPHAEILSLPFGGPQPVITFPAADHAHVLYPLAALNNQSPDLKFGAVIATGWRDNSPANLRKPTLRVLRVTFNNIRINNDHDPDILGIPNSGEWRLWLRAGSQWTEVTNLGDVNGGDTVSFNKSVTLIVPDDGSVPVGIQTTGWEDDCDSQFGPTIRPPQLSDVECKINGNDKIGIINHDFTKAENFGIGTHDTASSQNGDADTLDDFNLRYRIDQLAVINPPPVNTPGSAGAP